MANFLLSKSCQNLTFSRPEPMLIFLILHFLGNANCRNIFLDLTVSLLVKMQSKAAY